MKYEQNQSWIYSTKNVDKNPIPVDDNDEQKLSKLELRTSSCI